MELWYDMRVSLLDSINPTHEQGFRALQEEVRRVPVEHVHIQEASKLNLAPKRLTRSARPRPEWREWSALSPWQQRGMVALAMAKSSRLSLESLWDHPTTQDVVAYAHFLSAHTRQLDDIAGWRAAQAQLTTAIDKQPPQRQAVARGSSLPAPPSLKGGRISASSWAATEDGTPVYVPSLWDWWCVDLSSTFIAWLHDNSGKGLAPLRSEWEQIASGRLNPEHWRADYSLHPHSEDAEQAHGVRRHHVGAARSSGMMESMLAGAGKLAFVTALLSNPFGAAAESIGAGGGKAVVQGSDTVPEATFRTAVAGAGVAAAVACGKTHLITALPVFEKFMSQEGIERATPPRMANLDSQRTFLTCETVASTQLLTEHLTRQSRVMNFRFWSDPRHIKTVGSLLFKEKRTHGGVVWKSLAYSAASSLLGLRNPNFLSLAQYDSGEPGVGIMWRSPTLVMQEKMKRLIKKRAGVLNWILGDEKREYIPPMTGSDLTVQVLKDMAMQLRGHPEWSAVVREVLRASAPSQYSTYAAALHSAIRLATGQSVAAEGAKEFGQHLVNQLKEGIRDAVKGRWFSRHLFDGLLKGVGGDEQMLDRTFGECAIDGKTLRTSIRPTMRSFGVPANRSYEALWTGSVDTLSAASLKTGMLHVLGNIASERTPTWLVLGHAADFLDMVETGASTYMHSTVHAINYAMRGEDMLRKVDVPANVRAWLERTSNPRSVGVGPGPEQGDGADLCPPLRLRLPSTASVITLADTSLHAAMDVVAPRISTPIIREGNAQLDAAVQEDADAGFGPEWQSQMPDHSALTASMSNPATDPSGDSSEHAHALGAVQSVVRDAPAIVPGLPLPSYVTDAPPSLSVAQQTTAGTVALSNMQETEAAVEQVVHQVARSAGVVARHAELVMWNPREDPEQAQFLLDTRRSMHVAAQEFSWIQIADSLYSAGEGLVVHMKRPISQERAETLARTRQEVQEATLNMLQGTALSPDQLQGPAWRMWAGMQVLHVAMTPQEEAGVQGWYVDSVRAARALGRAKCSPAQRVLLNAEDLSVALATLVRDTRGHAVSAALLEKWVVTLAPSTEAAIKLVAAAHSHASTIIDAHETGEIPALALALSVSASRLASQLSTTLYMLQWTFGPSSRAALVRHLLFPGSSGATLLEKYMHESDSYVEVTARMEAQMEEKWSAWQQGGLVRVYDGSGGAYSLEPSHAVLEEPSESSVVTVVVGDAVHAPFVRNLPVAGEEVLMGVVPAASTTAQPGEWYFSESMLDFDTLARSWGVPVAVVDAAGMTDGTGFITRALDASNFAHMQAQHAELQATAAMPSSVRDLVDDARFALDIMITRYPAIFGGLRPEVQALGNVDMLKLVKSAQVQMEEQEEEAPIVDPAALEAAVEQVETLEEAEQQAHNLSVAIRKTAGLLEQAYGEVPEKHEGEGYDRAVRGAKPPGRPRVGDILDMLASSVSSYLSRGAANIAQDVLATGADLMERAAEQVMADTINLGTALAAGLQEGYNEVVRTAGYVAEDLADLSDHLSLKAQEAEYASKVLAEHATAAALFTKDNVIDPTVDWASTDGLEMLEFAANHTGRAMAWGGAHALAGTKIAGKAAWAGGEVLGEAAWEGGVALGGWVKDVGAPAAADMIRAGSVAFINSLGKGEKVAAQEAAKAATEAAPALNSTKVPVPAFTAAWWESVHQSAGHTQAAASAPPSQVWQQVQHASCAFNETLEAYNAVRVSLDAPAPMCEVQANVHRLTSSVQDLHGNNTIALLHPGMHMAVKGAAHVAHRIAVRTVQSTSPRMDMQVLGEQLDNLRRWWAGSKLGTFVRQLAQQPTVPRASVQQTAASRVQHLLSNVSLLQEPVAAETVVDNGPRIAAALQTAYHAAGRKPLAMCVVDAAEALLNADGFGFDEEGTAFVARALLGQALRISQMPPALGSLQVPHFVPALDEQGKAVEVHRFVAPVRAWVIGSDGVEIPASVRMVEAGERVRREYNRFISMHSDADLWSLLQCGALFRREVAFVLSNEPHQAHLHDVTDVTAVARASSMFVHSVEQAGRMFHNMTQSLGVHQPHQAVSFAARDAEEAVVRMDEGSSVLHTAVGAEMEGETVKSAGNTTDSFPSALLPVVDRISSILSGLKTTRERLEETQKAAAERGVTAWHSHSAQYSAMHQDATIWDLTRQTEVQIRIWTALSEHVLMTSVPAREAPPQSVIQAPEAPYDTSIPSGPAQGPRSPSGPSPGPSGPSRPSVDIPFSGPAFGHGHGPASSTTGRTLSRAQLHAHGVMGPEPRFAGGTVVWHEGAAHYNAGTPTPPDERGIVVYGAMEEMLDPETVARAGRAWAWMSAGLGLLVLGGKVSQMVADFWARSARHRRSMAPVRPYLAPPPRGTVLRLRGGSDELGEQVPVDNTMFAEMRIVGHPQMAQAMPLHGAVYNLSDMEMNSLVYSRNQRQWHPGLVLRHAAPSVSHVVQAPHMVVAAREDDAWEQAAAALLLRDARHFMHPIPHRLLPVLRMKGEYEDILVPADSRRLPHTLHFSNYVAQPWAVHNHLVLLYSNAVVHLLRDGEGGTHMVLRPPWEATGHAGLRGAGVLVNGVDIPEGVTSSDAARFMMWCAWYPDARLERAKGEESKEVATGEWYCRELSVSTDGAAQIVELGQETALRWVSVGAYEVCLDVST